MMDTSPKQRRTAQSRRAQTSNNHKHARAVELLEILNRQRSGLIDGPSSDGSFLPGVAPGRFAVERHTFSPNGKSGGSGSGFPSRFTGQKLDPETGRFITTDPIGYEGQRNLNAFVGSGPMNMFDPDGKQTGGNRPTGVIIIGDGSDIKNGKLYTYQLVDGNGGRVRGYEVKENTKLVSVEGNQNFGKIKDNKGFVQTSYYGTFKDEVTLPREIPISSKTYMIITAEQWFTVRGPDGVEFDLDTIFTHVITVSDGKVEVETRGGN